MDVIGHRVRANAIDQFQWVYRGATVSQVTMSCSGADARLSARNHAQTAIFRRSDPVGSREGFG
jgi:hypothetical protein